MNQYIGIDLHKAKSFVTRLDGRGRVLEQVDASKRGRESFLQIGQVLQTVQYFELSFRQASVQLLTPGW